MSDTLSLLAPAGALPIGTEWRTSETSAPVVFPFDGSLVANAPVSTVQDSRDALDAAEAARFEVAALSTAQRRSILVAITARVRAEAGRLEDLLILETGKPRRDCRVEVSRTIVTLEATAEEVAHLRGETVPLDLQETGRGMIGYFTRKPAGVVIGIAGFNAVRGAVINN